MRTMTMISFHWRRNPGQMILNLCLNTSLTNCTFNIQLSKWQNFLNDSFACVHIFNLLVYIYSICLCTYIQSACIWLEKCALITNLKHTKCGLSYLIHGHLTTFDWLEIMWSALIHIMLICSIRVIKPYTTLTSPLIDLIGQQL